MIQRLPLLVGALMFAGCAGQAQGPRPKDEADATQTNQGRVLVVKPEPFPFGSLGRSQTPTALDRPPRLLKSVSPRYPEDARKAGVEGTVRLEITVDEMGKVVETRVLGTPDGLLIDAAVKAVNQWVFAPHTVSGKPVKVRFVQPVRFAMEQSAFDRLRTP